MSVCHHSISKSLFLNSCFFTSADKNPDFWIPPAGKSTLTKPTSPPTEAGCGSGNLYKWNYHCHCQCSVLMHATGVDSLLLFTFIKKAAWFIDRFGTVITNFNVKLKYWKFHKRFWWISYSKDFSNFSNEVKITKTVYQFRTTWICAELL